MKNLGQVTENQDIARKQDIPTNTNQLTNGAGFITSSALSGYVPTSRTVNGKALSGNISLTASDVGALPSSTTIPTVNNGTLTIQKNGTNVQTFTANQSGNATANITVPTKTSDLTNDSGFITSADLPSGGGGGVTSVVGQTGDVTTSQLISAMLKGSQGYGDTIVSKEISANGYVKYKSGLIIQWGRSDKTTGTDLKTVNLPTAFTTTNYSVVLTTTGGQTNGNVNNGNYINSLAKGSFTYYNGYGSFNSQPYWLAIGY